MLYFYGNRWENALIPGLLYRKLYWLSTPRYGPDSPLIYASGGQGAFFEKTAPLDPPQKLLIIL
jgi:hypothetical protein